MMFLDNEIKRPEIDKIVISVIVVLAGFLLLTYNNVEPVKVMSVTFSIVAGCLISITGISIIRNLTNFIVFCAASFGMGYLGVLVGQFVY